MKIIEALNFAKKDLESDYLAREILKFTQNLDNMSLVLNFEKDLQNSEFFLEIIDKIKSGIPFEYISKKATFLDFEFYVDERVLIPRFETEILVEKVCEIAKDIKNPKILEIGVGSGIISICLKKRFENAKIIATDISKYAIEVAKINANRLNADIEFFNCAYFDEILDDFDIIVSNPPYICNSYKLDKMVLCEPNIALFGGEVGDEVLKNIIHKSQNRCKYLCCEMGYDQKKSLEKELLECGYNGEFYKDLAGFDRGFVAKRI